MNKYSLSSLAWYSRGMFFENFKADLIHAGLGSEDAHDVAAQSCKYNQRNILDVYQEYISDKCITDALDKIMYNFVERYTQ